MKLNIKTTKEINEVAEFVASSINRELAFGKKVLWFVSGGSSINVEVEIAKKIKETSLGSLVVTLADERYGPVDYSESNWLQLINAGFKIQKAKMIPILKGESIRKTTEDIIKNLKTELENADYKIGFFGIGIDSHTAGILPHTEAVKSNEIICTYETDLHNRITITPKTIMMLNEAILYAMGEVKWGAINNLEKDLLVDDEPVQILKRVPLLTIFTDYKSINI